MHLTDSTGWNDSASQPYNRGVILFGYRNAAGARYDHYSRLVEFNLFTTGGVDKSAHTVTLSTPLPATLANPDDPGGVWPAGTKIANSASGSGSGSKYVCYSGLHVPQTDRWYRGTGHIGGIDLSGANVDGNFPPGTAYVKPFWLPNYSNRSGSSSGHPDTGPAHRVWFAGVSVIPETLARMSPVTSGNATGSQAIKVPTADFASGTLSLQPATRTLEPL